MVGPKKELALFVKVAINCGHPIPFQAFKDKTLIARKPGLVQTSVEHALLRLRL